MRCCANSARSCVGKCRASCSSSATDFDIDSTLRRFHAVCNGVWFFWEGLLFSFLPHLKEEGRWPLPARIEGPPLYRGASASRKDRLPSPFFSPSSPTSLDEGRLVDPQLRASNEHILIVRVPRARGRLGGPHLLFVGERLIPLRPFPRLPFQTVI